MAKEGLENGKLVLKGLYWKKHENSRKEKL